MRNQPTSYTCRCHSVSDRLHQTVVAAYADDWRKRRESEGEAVCNACARTVRDYLTAHILPVTTRKARWWQSNQAIGTQGLYDLTYAINSGTLTA